MREIIKDDFDEISPITGEKMVLVEDNLRMDLSSGYQNMKDQWITTNEEVIAEVEQNLPTYILPFKFIADDGNVWYPMMSYSPTAIIFPIKSLDETFVWAVSRVERLINKDDINTHFVFPIPLKVDGKPEQVMHKVNNTPEKVFARDAFELAFDFYNELANEQN